MFQDSTTDEINKIMKSAGEAFGVYKKCTLKQRAGFMRTVALQIERIGDELLTVAGNETNLPEVRLRTERSRTLFQLNSYADACERGDWIEARIDTPVSGGSDIRKMLMPLGPVVVFGAANFPFAYSTAGGDTASAWAAGCPVIVKAHPAHAQTSELVASAILKAVKKSGLPETVFAHIHGASFAVGETLVKHPLTRAVGFTGSFAGGKQLFDWANQRKIPIPVFAEMSSINPVFLLPEKLHFSAEEIARSYAASITLGSGQFCTNPGLLVGIEGEDLDRFVHTLAAEIKVAAPENMLHSGIYQNYADKREEVLSQPGVTLLAVSENPAADNQGLPTIASVSAEAFIGNARLHQEVFGPFSLLVKCRNKHQMLELAQQLAGQLTATLMATQEDIKNNARLVDEVQGICGRFILNGVPTGVQVCLSMQHGGPFPATTDSRFTAVGADAIRRFARPVAFQNWDNELLPEALKNENPWGIWRTVDNRLSQNALV